MMTDNNDVADVVSSSGEDETPSDDIPAFLTDETNADEQAA